MTSTGWVRHAAVTSGFLLVVGMTISSCVEGGEEANVLIRGGIILDGSGSPGVVGDVAILGDVIVHVGPEGPAASDTIDATGLTVSPGFIDVHSHTPPALTDGARRLNEGVIRQGVTTVIGGPDGRFAPSQIEELADVFDEHGVGTNVAFYVGHNGVRQQVMGADQQRPPTADELEDMKALVREGMALGAFGLSTGLMYEPGMFSRTSEVIALAQEVEPFGGVYDSHVRNPVHDFVGSDQEVVAIAEAAEIPGKIGHLKAVGLHNEGAIRQIIGLVEMARSRGSVIVSDQYPYDGAATAALTDIMVVPPELDELALLARPDRQGSTDAFASALKSALVDPASRMLLRESSENGVDGGFAWLKATGYTSMRITSSEDFPDLVGAYLSEIAEDRGLDPFDVVASLILEATSPVNLTLGAIKEHDVRNLLVQPWNMIASDGGYADGSDSPEGHPRSAGTFARLMGHYARDEGLLSLEEAVRKVTSFPAEFHGLEGRGALEVGAFADIAVFDADRIIDRSDWDYPNRFADGVEYVLVNGAPVLVQGRMTGDSPGRVLRKAN
ncbi:MAG: N-acyl-D-amino-acid deacylase family protein [Longimicrobiales bacterium]